MFHHGAVGGSIPLPHAERQTKGQDTMKESTMTAAQAYRQAAHECEQYAGWVATHPIKTLARFATELEVIADHFEAHPDRWTFGSYRDGNKVCSVGLLNHYHRKAAGIKDFVRPRSLNSSTTVWTSFLIQLNDASDGADEFMGARNVVRVYRVLAKAVRDLIVMRQGGSITSDEVTALINRRMEAAARKAEWNKVHKAQRKPTPKGEGWDAEHQLGTVKAKTAKKGSK
jgi:hypothetical protein